MTLYMAIDNHHQPIMINQRISIYICSIEPSSQGLCVPFLKRLRAGKTGPAIKTEEQKNGKQKNWKVFGLHIFVNKFEQYVLFPPTSSVILFKKMHLRLTTE